MTTNTKSCIINLNHAMATQTTKLLKIRTERDWQQTSSKWLTVTCVLSCVVFEFFSISLNFADLA